MFKWHPFPMGVSRGEVLFLTWMVLLMGYWVLNWLKLNPTLVNIVEENAVKYIPLIIFARVVGHLAALMFSFVLLPVSRTGLWVDIFGVPYERALKYHRILGTFGFFLVIIHCGVNYIKWTVDGTLTTNIVAVNKLQITHYYVEYTNFSITLIELACLLMGISMLMAVTMRRRLYAVFQYSHKYIGIVFYVASLIHATNFWYVRARGQRLTVVLCVCVCGVCVCVVCVWCVCGVCVCVCVCVVCVVCTFVCGVCVCGVFICVCVCVCVCVCSSSISRTDATLSHFSPAGTQTCLALCCGSVTSGCVASPPLVSSFPPSFPGMSVTARP
jgi:hypothetical protein